MAVEVGERRPLSSAERAFLAVGSAVAVGLAIACAVVLWTQRRERFRYELTAARLDRISPDRKSVRRYLARRWRGLPSPSTPIPMGSDDDEGARDGWGRRFLFSAPGPVHKHGWDIWSVGPNGIDEQGGGDDILVGEDVAEVSSLLSITGPGLNARAR
jgi:hypothetical protein